VAERVARTDSRRDRVEDRINVRIIYYYFPFATSDYNRNGLQYHGGLQFIDELRRAGHAVDMINPFDRGTGLSRNEYDQSVVETVARKHKREPISLFFASVRDHEMSGTAVARIGELGVRTANVTWDDALMSHRVKNIAPAFDRYWVADPQALDVMKRLGARVFDQPAAANPHLFRPENAPEDVDVSFCGQRYGSRIYYIEELFKRNRPVEVYGVGWKSADEGRNPGELQRSLSFLPALKHIGASLTHEHGRTWARAALLRRLKPMRTFPELQAAIDAHTHPPLPFPEMVQLYSRSKLTLSFNEVAHTYLFKKPLEVARGRDFEAVASGACHMMKRMPAWMKHFEEDKEVLLYSSPEELADKIRFYLDPRRDSVRAEIRRQARARVLQEHTWTHRFHRLFRELDLEA